MGLRDRKKQETRTALGWAAIRLVVEHGYDRVLVEHIAAAADVSPRTFNNYFSSKAEAVASRQLDRFLRMADGLRARPAGEPLWEALPAAMAQEMHLPPELGTLPVTGRETWAAGLRAMGAVPAVQAENLRAAATAETAMAAAVGERTGTDPATDIYPRLVAAAALAAFTVVSRHYTEAAVRPESFPAELAGALRQISAGLPPPRA
jgi:AcrR family transcriptional regulator